MYKLISLDKVSKDKLESFCARFNWHYPLEEEGELGSLFQSVTEEEKIYFTSPRNIP